MTPLSRHLLEQIVMMSAEGVLVVDAHAAGLPIVYVNTAFERQSGYTAAELVGHSWPLLERDPSEPGLQQLKEAIGRGEAATTALLDLTKQGRAWRAEVSVAPLYQGPGDLRYLLFQQRPAAGQRVAAAAGADAALERELRRAQLKIANLSRQDSRTGLLQWDFFLEQVHRDVCMAQRDQRSLAMLVFEITELDIYRDTFGSKAADSCMRMIAAQVAGALKRAGDLSSRCAQNDRIVALVHGHDYGCAHAFAARIRDNIRGLALHNPRGSRSRFIDVAIGVAAGVPASQAAAEVCQAMLEAAGADLAGQGDSEPPAVPTTPSAKLLNRRGG